MRYRKSTSQMAEFLMKSMRDKEADRENAHWHNNRTGTYETREVVIDYEKKKQTSDSRIRTLHGDYHFHIKSGGSDPPCKSCDLYSEAQLQRFH